MTADLPGPDRATGTLSEAERTNHLRAPKVDARTPTEGVKLEPVGYDVSCNIGPPAFVRFDPNTPEGWAYRAIFPPTATGYTVTPLVSGPQAAKRIEELEAEVARLSSLAFGLMNGDDQ